MTINRPPPLETFGEAATRLYRPLIAHRGLWGAGVPENSLSAFQHAVTKGYSLSLDVRLSSDEDAIVFHDETLGRMTGHSGRVRDLSTRDLQALALSGTEETIPTLTEALAVIGHHSFVLINLETPPGEVGSLEKRVHSILLDHKGPVALASPNPYSLAWFVSHHPKVLRGLGLFNTQVSGKRPFIPTSQAAKISEALALAKPHFLVVDQALLSDNDLDILKNTPLPKLVQVVRDSQSLEDLKPFCANLFFEGFCP